jgi:LPS sulfotransferase NodH
MAADGTGTIPLRPRKRRFDLAPLRLLGDQMQHQWKLWLAWWTHEHTPYQPLFVLATHRSGSNLLMDYLQALPGVSCASEILCRKFPTGPTPWQVGPRPVIGHIRRSLHPLHDSTRGCKFMLDQLAGSRLTLNELQAAFPSAKYIVLYRQSLVEQYVSKQAALATDQWTLCDERQRKDALVQINPAALRSYCERVGQSYRETLSHSWLRERGLLLSYEQLVADPRRIVREEICSLLEVPAAEPQTYLLKQNRLPLAQRVENYWEVAALLHSPLCQQHYTWTAPQRQRLRAA